jgi:gliding motility-associated-like protein
MINKLWVGIVLLCGGGVFIPLYGQDFSGDWQGTNHSPGSATAEYWPVSLKLTQNGNDLSGTMHFSAREKPQYFVKFYVVGRVTGTNSFTLVINKIVEENKEDPTNIWCVGEGDFSLDPAGNKFSGVIKFSNCPFEGRTDLYRLELVSEQFFCKSSQASLQVTGSNVRWYADEQKSQLLQLGNSYHFQIEENTTFYVTQTHNNTESPVLPVTVTVRELDFDLDAQVNCGASQGAISITTAIQGIEFRLNEGPYSKSNSFDNLSFGNYVVTGRFGECTSRKEIILSEKRAPLLEDLQTERVTCAGRDGGLVIQAASNYPPLQFALGDGDYQLSNEFSALNEGTYEVRVKDSTGCETSRTAEILPSENSVRIIEVESEAPTCGLPNGQLRIVAEGGTSFLTYSLDGVRFQTENQFDSLVGSSYVVHVRDENQCLAQAAAELPESFPLAELQYTKTNPSCGKADGSIEIKEPEGDEFSYRINQGASSPMRRISNLSAGVYHIQATSQEGCTVEGSVEIEQLCTDHVQFPSAISPNSDSVNDVFAAFFSDEELHVVQLSIFNRWGNVIFKRQNFKIKSGELLWNGMPDQHEGDSKTYAYVMEVAFPSQEHYTYRGFVEIIR